VEDPPFYSPEGLAELLSVPLATVYRWNSTGTGPRRILVGKHVRYRRSDVEKWLERCSRDPEPAA
jgi:excisionase family DNA binding protein